MSMESVSIVNVRTTVGTGNGPPDPLAIILDTLIGLGYRVVRLTTLCQESGLVRSEIDWCTKYSDVVIVCGDDRRFLEASLAKLLSGDVTMMPTHVKTITGTGCRVVHAHRIFLLDPDRMLDSFGCIRRQLEHYRRDRTYKKVLTVEPTSLTVLKEIQDNGVSLELVRQCDTFVYKISSKRLQNLLDFEKKILGCGAVSKVDETEIWSSIRDSSDPLLKASLETVEKCLDIYGAENVFISFNGGKDCTVLLHLVFMTIRMKFPQDKGRIFCLYVQSEHPFPEQDKFISQCQSYYDLDVLTVRRDIKEALKQTLAKYPHYRACFMGTRRTDPYAGELKHFQMSDKDWPEIMRCSPLLDWHYSDIWDYLLYYKIPYCELYDMGFTSLGNAVNTRKNSSLAYYDVIQEKDTYLPAYKLLREVEERNGRNSN